MSAEALLLRFQVQGSAATPYRLTAEGIGAAFRMLCSCPAGRKARMMCKHVSALLMGDVSALVYPSDCLLELARRAHGSEVLARAFHHQPAKTKPLQCPEIVLDAPIEAGFAAAFSSLLRSAEAAGWSSETFEDGFYLYRPKNKRKRIAPPMSLGFAEGARHPYQVFVEGKALRCFDSPQKAGGYFVSSLESLTLQMR